MCEDAADRTILNVGCGRQAMVLRRFMHAYRYAIGLDMEASQGSDIPAGIHLIESDALSILLPDSSVDVVAMGHVVEHFAEPVRVLRECRCVLRPGGRLVILTVNARFPPIALARILPHRPRQLLNRMVTGTHDEDTFPAFYHLNTVRKIRDAGMRAGFVSLEVAHVSDHPLYFMFSTTVYRAAVLVERIVARRHALRGLRHFLFAVMQKPVEEASRSAAPEPAASAELRTSVPIS